MESLFAAKSLADLLNQSMARWHEQPLATDHADPFLALSLGLHAHNFELWHEEDKARDPDAEDGRIAQVKRAIDGMNQRRNNAMEAVDEFMLQTLEERGITASSEAPLHSESVGAIVDRLSILALKVFHMREQTERHDADPSHIQTCIAKLAVLEEQQHDLAQCLAELQTSLLAGERRFKVYRQMKMYNDPNLNPVLYGKASRG